MKSPEKIRTDAATAVQAIPDARERAQAAVDLTEDLRRIRRDAFAELKKDHSFAAIGQMFGMTGSRVDQIIRGK
ncbi:MAG TPA: hypothetical protein VGX23_33655 [Actinocrinis sp.]|nr:hypothetical protein [Actinocrinis sp.]